MKSNKQPTAPIQIEPGVITSGFSDEAKKQLIEIMPKPDDSFVNLLSRAQFIFMMNGVMERIGKIDKELDDIEEILLDRNRFARLSVKEQIQIYRSLEKRQAGLRSDAIRVHEIGSRTEFNRTFFGIQAQIAGTDQVVGEDTASLLTKPARHVLSEISKFVTVRAGSMSRSDDAS